MVVDKIHTRKKKLVERETTESMSEDALATVVSILLELCNESGKRNEEIEQQEQSTNK